MTPKTRIQLAQLYGVCTRLPIRILGSLVFPKCEENKFGSEADLNSRFEATPAVNITCLEDYIYKGENTISVYLDPDRGWINEAYPKGCTERPDFQVIAVLKNELNPNADEIVFSARYKAKFVNAPYEYEDAPTNPFEGLNNNQLAELCDEQPIPAPVADQQLIAFCRNKYNPNIAFSGPAPDDLFYTSNLHQDKSSPATTLMASPNPFKDWLRVTMNLNWEPQMVILSLSDPLGKIIWKDHIFYSGGILHYQIDQPLNTLPAGTYQARVQGVQQSETLTLLKH
ncbi:hypothetical protein [Phaeodactylibacter luteus]|uniref:Uncharacterized protein n=1 Tax=Phaeodactylibacter luteus TaxID=1564516 RepID=A0A5C6RHY1_9BACT|nr:hypothetical protein [Phaeodactylibacter luteus]TXB58833.1 hypothetical protein FRY97_21455 [Phaeodactylibacter luteus]